MLPEGGEWVVIFIVVFLLFGAKKIPELTRSAAQAMKEFKKVQNGDDDTPSAVTAQPTQAVTSQPTVSDRPQ
ncbi:twin-arginine translocase TatA/TatE family subunit [Kribbella antibiotica]|uniref:Sec-independent protein translocase protein TatA n=2 Tax=Kribbella antibiotica TaxID=190195 RepID=A0A4R4YV45_9ACTN|nr:twin-arginine translocase TatA/TatE family subunit [Kribbella antibiotica]